MKTQATKQAAPDDSRREARSTSYHPGVRRLIAAVVVATAAGLIVAAITQLAQRSSAPVATNAQAKSFADVIKALRAKGLNALADELERTNRTAPAATDAQPEAIADLVKSLRADRLKALAEEPEEANRTAPVAAQNQEPAPSRAARAGGPSQAITADQAHQAHLAACYFYGPQESTVAVYAGGGQ